MEKIFAGKNGGAVFTCPHCGFVKTFDASAYRNRDSRLTLKCQCGQQVPVLIEFREHYRKQVNLSGECFLPRTNSTFHIRIKDLSLSGLFFTILSNMREDRSPFLVNDAVTIQFYLDEHSQKMIERKAVVKNIKESGIGVNFTQTEYDKELGFYFLR